MFDLLEGADPGMVEGKTGYNNVRKRQEVPFGYVKIAIENGHL